MSDLLDKLMAYEDEQMSRDETIKFFQELIDSGDAWTLQGKYGRMASYLIDAGHCTQPKTNKA